MVNIISKLEGIAMGTGPALYNLAKSWNQGHTYCIAESTFELTGAIATGQYYFAKFLDTLPLIALVFTTHVPYFIYMVAHLIPLRETLGALGIITNTAKGIKDALSLYRQHQFLKLFEKHAWQGSDTRDLLAGTIEHFDEPEFLENLPLKFKQLIIGRKEQLKQLLTNIEGGDQKSLEKAEKLFAYWTGRNIRDKLVEITNLSDVELERALPEWLYNDIVDKGGQDYLRELHTKMEKGDLKAIKEASNLLDTMQSYARKKSILHILKIIGAVINVVACIGFFVALPWPVTVIFLLLIGISGAAAYMYNAGYVENREDAFSLKLCVPEFIRNLAFDLYNCPEAIRAWLNEKIPKKPTPHPFSSKSVTVAPLKTSYQIPEPYSQERLERCMRLAAKGVLLPNSD